MSIWQESYNNLKTFIQQNNRLPSQKSKNHDEKILGMWCQRQRWNKKCESLTEDQINHLQNLPGWFWNKLDIWQENYNRLKIFIQQNNRLPSSESKNPEEKLLGKWCCRQRIANRGQNSPHTLTANQINQLEILPYWIWNKLDTWQENYNQLKTFIQQNDRLPSSRSQSIHEKSLAMWCSRQRIANRGQNPPHTLTANQINQLEKLPYWSWVKDGLISWQRKYNQVKIFIDKHNRLPFKTSKNQHEKILGIWCNTQRQIKKGKNNSVPLNENQIKLLEQLPHWYWEYDLHSNWQKKYDQLKTFIEQNKRLPSGQKSDEKQLSIWCKRQRQAKKGTGNRLSPLTETQITLLEQLPNWFWQENLSDIWNERYIQLKNFIETHHHLPRSIRQEKSLYSWLFLQQKNKNLTIERQQLLSSLLDKKHTLPIEYPNPKKRKIK